MQQNILFIGWHHTRSGREKKAEELFAETVGFFRQKVKDKKLEAVDTLLLGGNPTLEGCFVLRADPKQMQELAGDVEYQRILLKGNAVLENLTVVPGYAGDAVGPVMETWGQYIRTF